MLKKAIRTLQNFFPMLAETKNDVYHVTRKHLGLVHDREFAMIRALPPGPEDLFVDVGANRGQSILAIRHYRPDARIVSFEPNPAIFARLRHRFGDTPGVRLENVGLAPRPGEWTLFVPSYRGFVYDGLATFSREAAASHLSPDTLYFFDPAHLAVAEHSCTARTLDSFNLRPSFIKIDVEGFEHDVLEGGLETLRQHCPVLLLERCYGDERVGTLLAGLGYREVVLEGGRFVPGHSDGLNMVMMTDRSRHAAG